MKKLVRILVPILLTVLVIGSIGWYLFVYDRDFTRDMLLQQARLNDTYGNTNLSAWFYRMAYTHSGNDEDVAIELANQYRAARNYTKAEVTLSNAINANPSAELYTALCNTFVEQDKLMDAVALLSGIRDEQIRAEIERLRPSAPSSPQIPGLYHQYISVDLVTTGTRIFYTTNGEYPSVQSPAYSDPIKLSVGETTIHCISVDNRGLVSPVSVLAYTVGGVVEPAIFMDASVEFALRDTLGMNYDDVLYTSDLWDITEFTVPKDIWTMEDLVKLPHLKSLIIHDLNLVTLADLANLPELESLDLSGCRFQPSELAYLAQISNLNKLIISNCGLSTLADLGSVSGLTYLDASNNTLRNLDPLLSMENMHELYLAHNAVTGLEALSLMHQLEKLDISSNSVYDLAPLSACYNLTWLNASTNQISNISTIGSLSRLESLALDYNQLTSINSLSTLYELRELSISNNQLRDITALSPLTKLEVFDFSRNSIQGLPAWGSSSALRILQGNYNQLTSIYTLNGLGSLTYVSLDYNSLTNIDVLANCYNLVQVNAYGNSISDISALTAHNIIVNYDPTN